MATTTAPSPGSDLLSGGSTTPTTTPPANQPAAATSSSTFPGSTPAQASGLPAPPNMSVAAFTAFASQHGVSSTEMANYIDTSTGSLTGWAQEFLNYYQANSETRQAIQDQLVDADLLPEASANGSVGSTTNTAFNTAMSSAVKQGVPLDQYLQSAAGPGQLQQLIAKQASSAQTMQADEQPTSFGYTDPNTLTANLSSAFEAAVGHAPTAAETAAFIANFHGQESSDANAYKQAYASTATADAAQIQKETSALDNLPATELDKFVSAYQQAIGSSDQQGPVTGTQTLPGAVNPNPSGQLFGTSSGSVTTTKQEPGSLIVGMGGGTHAHSTITPGVPAKLETAPNAPVGSPGTSVVHGGEWAISPLLWQEAQSLLPKTKLPATPAQASVAMQQAAFTALAQYFQQETGSWTDTATILASGNPNAAQTPATVGGNATTGKPSTHIDNFTTTIVNQTNSALTALQNEATAGPAVETIGKETPNATDDALAAAKSSDPAGYYSNQMSMYEGLLNQLLYGTPISEDTRQSNIQGPVLSDAGPTAAAPTPGPTTAPTASAAPATAAT